MCAGAVAGGGTGVNTGVDRLVFDRVEDNCSTSTAFGILFILGRGAMGILGVERLRDGGSIGDPVRLVALLSILLRGVAVCGRLDTSVDIAEILGLVADLALGNDGTGVPPFGVGDAWFVAVGSTGMTAALEFAVVRVVDDVARPELDLAAPVFVVVVFVFPLVE